jgi:hypothetical protein
VVVNALRLRDHVPAALDLERPALNQVDAIAAIREEVRRELDVDEIVVGLST